MHCHLVDFLQETQGIKTLLKKMKQHDIRTVIFGLPIKKKWSVNEPLAPHYYLDDNARCYYYSGTDEIVASEYLKLSPKDRKYFAPTLCGFNPTDLSAIDYVKMMFKKYPFWRGVGELLLRHDDLTNITNEETARANHPALFPIYKFCAEKKVPVCIHQDSTSIERHDIFEYVGELEEALKKHKKTTFIWAHCGISYRISHKNYHIMIEKLLKKYSNLYVDISWIVYEEVICEGSIVKQEWIDLIKKFPNRFMIGSDLIGNFDNYGPVLGRYGLLFEKLPKKAVEMISVKNAEKLYFS